MQLNRDNWSDIIDTMRDKLGKPNYPAYDCFRLYGVCPAGIFTRMSAELLELYAACDGVSRLCSPLDYYSLPNVYVVACRIIDTESRHWKKVKADGDTT